MLHIIHLFFCRILQLALEVIAEMKPLSGKAKESYDALMRLVEGEKEVAWAEQQNSVILPHIAPHLADDTSNNISPAFLQSSGILTCHNASFDTTTHNETVVVGNNNGDSFDSGSIAVEMLNSSYPKQVDVMDDIDVTSTATSSFHGGTNATPCWAEKTPVAMAIEQKRGVTTPLFHTVTKLRKSPHPRALQTSLATTHVITPSSHSNISKSPFVPSSVAREKQCVGVVTSKHNTTPKCSYKPNTTNHRNVEKGTPGSKRPFVNLPPIFAPTVMKTKSESPDEVPPNNCQSQTTELDCDAGTSEIIGFEDDFVPFNAYPMASEAEHNTTYHIDKDSSISLNQTYTRALNELEEEKDIGDDTASKVVARRVGQEIWQKVNNIDNRLPLIATQWDEENVKKIPGYLTMTKSAAIKRQPSTRQPLVRSNKENVPGGRKRTNTMKQSNRTVVRPLARSASFKSRPVTFNW